jgi:hypothetical protein
MIDTGRRDLAAGRVYAFAGYPGGRCPGGVTTRDGLDNAAGRTGLGWTGLGWTGLGWTGLGWTAAGWAALGWAAVGWTALGWNAVACG